MWDQELFDKTNLYDMLDGDSVWTKEELIDYAESHGAPRAALDILAELDESVEYSSVYDVWPDKPDIEDMWNDDEN